MEAPDLARDFASVRTPEQALAFAEAYGFLGCYSDRDASLAADQANAPACFFSDIPW